MSEWKPYPCKVNGEKRYLVRNDEQRAEFLKTRINFDYRVLGLVALAPFWNKSETDYIAVSTMDDEGKEIWTKLFEMYELLDWMAGFSLHPDRQRDLDRIHRNAHTFSSEYGWRPDTVVEWIPSEQEEDVYVDYMMNKDEGKNGSLLVPKDFLEGLNG